MPDALLVLQRECPWPSLGTVHAVPKAHPRIYDGEYGVDHKAVLSITQGWCAKNGIEKFVLFKYTYVYSKAGWYTNF